jgi:hypothetical protein
MNIYRSVFVCACPTDGECVVYSLTIRSPEMIAVERINAATAIRASAFHETIADHLHAALGGEQTLCATHQGVDIETVRK